MKNAKKIISLILVIAFTLSLGYFATLTPTGAWLYDSAKQEGDYTFGTFDVTNGQFSISEDITFDATTKFNDYIGESDNKKVKDDAAVDFNNAHEFEDPSKDKIVYKRDITVTNSGNVPARIYVTIDGGILNPETNDGTVIPNNSLNASYFFYEIPENEASVRKSMEDEITAFNNGIKATAENRMGLLVNYQRGYITIPQQTGDEPTTMTLRVMFWADHDVVGSILDNTDDVQTLKTDARIILTAIQDTEGAIENYYSTVKGTWDGSTTEEPRNDGTNYFITTASELAWISEQVAKSTENTFENKFVKLENDIDLGNHNWLPIGGFSKVGTQVNTNNCFKGTFDGQGHIIYNLKVTGTVKHASLFGLTAATTTIKNLGIDGFYCSMTSETTSEYAYVYGAAALVGYAPNTVIENCFARNGAAYTKGGSNNAAGLVASGGATAIKISNCYVQNVTVTNETSGSSYAGGIIGYIKHTSAYINNCYTVAKITNNHSTAKNGIGAIAGYLESNPDSLNKLFAVNVGGNANQLVGPGSNAAAISDANSNGAFVSSTDMKADIMPERIGTAFVVGNSANNGYPMLSWETK